MSWKATAYVKPLKSAPPKADGSAGEALTRSEKFLLLILADYHNEEQRCAWPSGATLASDALMTVRYVWILVESLRKKGLLCVGRRVEKSGDNGTNVYKFHALDCGDDHEGGSELSSLPPRPKKAPGGSELSSLGSDLFSLGSELAGSPGSDPPITRVVNPGSLGSELASSHKPPSEPSGEPPPNRHTHTGAPAPPSGPAPASDGVCVSGGSIPSPRRQEASGDLTRDDYRAFARAHDSFTAPDAWAETHWGLRDRDELVREWKEGRSPERIEEARAAPADDRMGYFYALQYVGSTAAAQGRDPLAVVEELSGNGQLAGGVREKLVERFAPAAAARAP